MYPVAHSKYLLFNGKYQTFGKQKQIQNKQQILMIYSVYTVLVRQRKKSAAVTALEYAIAQKIKEINKP